MKITIKVIAGIAVMAASASMGLAQDGNSMISGYSGNLQLIGPGQNQPKMVPTNAFPNAYTWDSGDDYYTTQSLGKVYKFTLVGIEAHADADGVPGWYSWGGYMQTFSEQQAIDWGQGVLDCTEAGGWWFEGGVNGTMVEGIWFETAKVGYRGEVSQSFLSSAKVYNDKNITLEWYIWTNSRGIDGYMKILGTVQKSKPVPTGQLIFNNDTFLEDAVPTVGWDINRNS